jgi:hypothetical protein
MALNSSVKPPKNDTALREDEVSTARKMSRFTLRLLFAATVLSTGCERFQQDEYHFVTAPSGECFVFHPKTGRISRVTKDGIVVLRESTSVLRIGEYYKMEDASGDLPFLKYTGGGKFESAKWAVKKISD